MYVIFKFDQIVQRVASKRSITVHMFLKIIIFTDNKTVCIKAT